MIYLKVGGNNMFIVDIKNIKTRSINQMFRKMLIVIIHPCIHNIYQHIYSRVASNEFL
jgi:hypothetical protein